SMQMAELTETSRGLLNSPLDAAMKCSLEVASDITRQPIALLGFAFDNLTLSETVERIEQMIASGHSHYVVTANVDFLVQGQRNVEGTVSQPGSHPLFPTLSATAGDG